MGRTDTEGIAHKYSKKLLSNLRLVVDNSSLQRDRLPKWEQSANVRTTYIYNTLLMMIEDNVGGDRFEHIDSIDTDIEFFLELDDYPAPVPPNSVGRKVRQEGEFQTASIIQSLTLNLGTEGSRLLGFDFDYHQPMIVVDAQVELSENGNPTATRYIPFALYVHTDELSEPLNHFINLVPRIFQSLQLIHDSPKGDELEQQQIRQQSVLGRKDHSVVVLGNYDDNHKSHLKEFRDYANQKGYDSHLIDELPAHKGMSLRDKLRTWSSTARFCVMIDDSASGHNNEYEILREQETIFAILQPTGSGSTFMMGPEHSDRREVFEYEETPLEVVEEAIAWAEQTLEDEIDKIDNHYPWRSE